MQRVAWIFWAFPILALRLSATPMCIAGGTLASYEALGATGCTIGPQTVENFSFSVVSVTGTATAVADTNISVTPTFGVDFYGVLFASAGFVTGSGTVEYLIGFTWDSIPIRGMGDALDPGNVDISTDGCVGSAFPCGGSPVNVDVNPTQLTDSVFFSPTGVLGISNDIALAMNGSFSSIENDAYVTPEPASYLLAALGLAVLAPGLRRLSGQTADIRL